MFNFNWTHEQMVARIMMAISVLISVSLHEFGHAKAADFLGDDTPRHQGRVTLNPLAHLDPVGTLGILVTIFAGYGFGWGKPVQTVPLNYTKVSMRAGMWLVTAAGPMVNLVLAMLFAIPLRLGWFDSDPDFSFLWAWIMVQTNIGLFLFNLLPVPPLDGSKLILPLFDRHTADRLMHSYQQVGILLLAAVVLMGIPSKVLAPATATLTEILIGR